MLREHIFDRHTRGLFDFGVRIDKGQVQRGGKAPAYRRLARPHHANKNDAAFLKGAPYGPRQGSGTAAVVLRRHSRTLQAGVDRNSSTYAYIPLLDNEREERQPFAKGTGLEAFMPTLLRFLTIIGILVGLFYGSMFVLANFFEPQPREMTKSIRDAKIR